jgi:DNA-binding NarL/FixJ family response regulator
MRAVTEVSARVVLAEDDVLLREGLAGLLERSGFDVIGQASTADELFEIVSRHRIRSEFPETAILILSAHVEVEHAMDLLAAGARTGYLLKSRITDVDEFIDTVRRVIVGGSAVDPVLVQELIAARRVSDPLEEITAREREVLALMAEGLSNSGIAQRLWVTEGTVEKHVHSILSKLGLLESGDTHRRVLAVLTYLENR